MNAVVSSPFIASSSSVRRVMALVLLAMVPGMLTFIYFFGWGVLINMGLTLASAWLFEVMMLLLLQKPLQPFMFDFSALVTALLLAMALPPLVAWWLPVLAMFFAIVVAKHLYGGLGYNPFNPAMAAYCILLVSFPAQMSVWLSPSTLDATPLNFFQSMDYVFNRQWPSTSSIDAVSSATILDHMRIQLSMGQNLAQLDPAPVFGLIAGRGMEWVNLAFLLGGLFLIYKRIISWHIPLAMIISLAVIASVFHWIQPQHYYGPLLHLFAGASMLGAFFIATDPVTAATTPRGKLIYGAGIGLLIYAIRIWGAYPDGVAFAVILMGLTVPLLDQYTVPKVFGTRSGRDRSGGDADVRK
jgi:electron transport complex protein RnfD